MINALAASLTTVFLKGTRIKAEAFNAVQFGQAWVRAAKAVLAVWPLVSLLTLTAVALAGSSTEAHGVVKCSTALLRHHALTG